MVELPVEPIERVQELRSRLQCVRAQCVAIGNAMRREERAMTPFERKKFDALKADREVIAAELRELMPRAASDLID